MEAGQYEGNTGPMVAKNLKATAMEVLDWAIEGLPQHHQVDRLPMPGRWGIAIERT